MYIQEKTKMSTAKYGNRKLVSLYKQQARSLPRMNEAGHEGAGPRGGGGDMGGASLEELLVRRRQLYNMECSLLQEYQSSLPRRRRPTTETYDQSAEALEEKLRKLESDRENLVLQVSVLTDQVEAQGNKITDLETTLDKKCFRLDNELVSRTALETHKLDLMAEISALKLKLATSEKDREEITGKLNSAQKRIDDLQSRLNERTIEVSDLRTRITKNGTITSADQADGNKTGTFERDRTLDREKTLDRLKRKHTEVEKLKKAVESLMATNEEKDQHIDELRRMLKKYKRIEDMVSTSHGRKGLESLGVYGLDDDHSDTSSNTQHSSSTDNSVRPRPLQNFERLEIIEPGDHSHRPNMPNPSATSTPVQPYLDRKPPLPNSQLNNTPPSVIGLMTPVQQRPTSNGSGSLPRSNSAENLSSTPGKTPPTVRKREEGYGTLPASISMRQTPSPSPPRSINNSSAPRQPQPHTSTLPPRGVTRNHSLRSAQPPQQQPQRKSRFASFGKGFLKLRSGKWTSSAPDLAQNETDDEAMKDEMAQQYKAMQSNTVTEQKKKKGLKRFFGKLRRSSSQDLDGEGLEDFRRSGLRSTAGPRLGWSKDVYRDLEVPFARWDGDRVATWLHSIGLSMYVGECKRWVKNGEQLLRASSHDLEKELGVRSHFHRKKLQLALQAVGSNTRDKMDELDHNWVTRWMDDIGLPQYKDFFSEARIDGRMLNYLTVEDLVNLKVTNALHHLSIKRGIQVLRMNNFNPICLKRRPEAGENSQNITPSQVMLWTNHRVMEWLRTIDLSEYAPNLRGSGVHGALMVLEPRYSAEIFASLLSIPGSKTLLRRHLSTHFVALVGQDVQHKKRELEAQPGYTPLTPNQKIKYKKFGLFGHRRTRSDPDFGDEDGYICPFSNGHANGGPAHKRDEKDEKAAKEIGAFSNEINTLTTMLSREQFMDDVPTSNV